MFTNLRAHLSLREETINFWEFWNFPPTTHLLGREKEEFWQTTKISRIVFYIANHNLRAAIASSRTDCRRDNSPRQLLSKLERFEDPSSLLLDKYFNQFFKFNHWFQNQSFIFSSSFSAWRSGGQKELVNNLGWCRYNSHCQILHWIVDCFNVGRCVLYLVLTTFFFVNRRYVMKYPWQKLQVWKIN